MTTSKKIREKKMEIRILKEGEKVPCKNCGCHAFGIVREGNHCWMCSPTPKGKCLVCEDAPEGYKHHHCPDLECPKNNHYTPHPPDRGWEEVIEDFNKTFRNTSWYPDNWEDVEDFIRKALLSQEKRLREEMVEEIKENLKRYRYWNSKTNRGVINWSALDQVLELLRQPTT